MTSLSYNSKKGMIKMGMNCINPVSNLIFNPDNNNYCRCQCRVNMIDVVNDSVTFGTERQYSTHLICRNCNHYVFLANSQNMHLSVELADIPEKYQNAVTALNKILAYVHDLVKASVSIDITDIETIEKYAKRGLGEKH